MGSCAFTNTLQDGNTAFLWAGWAWPSEALMYELAAVGELRSFLKATLEPLTGNCQCSELCWVRVLIPRTFLYPGPSIAVWLSESFGWSAAGSSMQLLKRQHCEWHLRCLPEGSWGIHKGLFSRETLHTPRSAFRQDLYMVISKYLTKPPVYTRHTHD